MASRSKKKEVYRKELQDAKCISRKKRNFTMSYKVYLAIKILLILLIPIFYFVYSPLLVALMVAYLGCFFMARMTERGMNKSVIKSNHIHIPTFDSALALVVIIVALCVVLLDSALTFDNFAALMTGQRNVFDSIFKFGTVENKPLFPNIAGTIDMSHFVKLEDILKNLPTKEVISTSQSTITTVLVFFVPVVSALTLVYVYYRCKKFNRVMNEVVVDEKLLLSNTDIDEILSFGEYVEGSSVSEDEINRKINERKQVDDFRESNSKFTTVDLSDNEPTEDNEDIGILN